MAEPEEKPEELEWWDLVSTSSPKCPYCGYEDEDWHEYTPQPNEVESWECPHCHKEYECTMELVAEFTSNKKSDEETINHA